MGQIRAMDVKSRKNIAQIPNGVLMTLKNTDGLLSIFCVCDAISLIFK